MKLAALADLAGGGGWAMLTEQDPVRREVRQAVAIRAAEQREEERRHLAIMFNRTMNGKQP